MTTWPLNHVVPILHQFVLVRSWTSHHNIVYFDISYKSERSNASNSMHDNSLEAMTINNWRFFYLDTQTKWKGAQFSWMEYFLWSIIIYNCTTKTLSIFRDKVLICERYPVPTYQIESINFTSLSSSKVMWERQFFHRSTSCWSKWYAIQKHI